MLLIFLFENSEFKSKRTGFYLPVLFISLGTLISLYKHSNVSSTSEFAVYLCSMVGLGFIATFFSYNESKRMYLYNLILFFVALLAIYGIFQYFYVFPQLKKESYASVNAYDPRLTSVLTSPAAFASVVILIWPSAYYMLFVEKDRMKKIFYGIALALLFLSLLLTFSKSAFAAIILQSLVISLFLRKNYPHLFKSFLKAMFILICIIFLAGASYLIFTGRSVNISISSFKLSLEGRYSLWMTALKMFAENPFTGVGGWAFKDVFYKYQFDGFYSTNAHSSFLQAFAEMGILGGLGFLLLTIYALLRCCVLNKQFNLSKFLGLGTLGFFFMNLFDSLLYVNLVGYLFALLLGIAYAEIEKPIILHRDFPRNAFIAFFVAFLVLSLLVNIAYYLNLSGRNILFKDFEAGLRNLKLASILNPIQGQYHQSLSQAYSAGSLSNKAYRYLKIIELKRAIFLEPYNPRYYFELGYFYETEGQPELSAYFYKKAIELAPKQPFYYYQLARLYYEGLKPDIATRYLKQCLSLEYYYRKRYVFQSYRSDIKRSEYDPYLSMARAALTLGNISLSKEDYKKALSYYEKAINLYPSLDEAYAARSSANIRLKNYKKAAQDAEKAINLNPENPDYYYFAAVAYYHVGQYDISMLYIKQALKLEPSNKIFQDFYRELRKVYGE